MRLTQGGAEQHDDKRGGARTGPQQRVRLGQTGTHHQATDEARPEAGDEKVLPDGAPTQDHAEQQRRRCPDRGQRRGELRQHDDEVAGRHVEQRHGDGRRRSRSHERALHGEADAHGAAGRQRSERGPRGRRPDQRKPGGQPAGRPQRAAAAEQGQRRDRRDRRNRRGRLVAPGEQPGDRRSDGKPGEPGQQQRREANRRQRGRCACGVSGDGHRGGGPGSAGEASRQARHPAATRRSRAAFRGMVGGQGLSVRRATRAVQRRSGPAAGFGLAAARVRVDRFGVALTRQARGVGREGLRSTARVDDRLAAPPEPGHGRLPALGLLSERGEPPQTLLKIGELAAVVGIDLQARVDRAVHGSRQIGAPARERRHRARRASRRLCGRRAAPRVQAGERLKDDERQRKDVGRRLGAVAARLLGRHVGHRADHIAGGGQSLGVGQRSDAEVGQLRPRAGLTRVGRAEDVGWLHIAVHDAVRVRVREGEADRAGEAGDVAFTQRAGAQHGAQVGAVDELADEDPAVVGRLGVDQLDDRRMLEAGGGKRFALSPLIGAADPLDRDVAPAAQITGAGDDAHAATADHAQRLIPPEQRPAGRGPGQFVVERWHRCAGDSTPRWNPL